MFISFVYNLMCWSWTKAFYRYTISSEHTGTRYFHAFFVICASYSTHWVCRIHNNARASETHFRKWFGDLTEKKIARLNQQNENYSLANSHIKYVFSHCLYVSASIKALNYCQLTWKKNCFAEAHRSMHCEFLVEFVDVSRSFSFPAAPWRFKVISVRSPASSSDWIPME